MSETRDEKLKRLNEKLTLISASYANAVNQIKSGKPVPASTINELSDEKQNIKNEIAALEVTPDASPASSPQPGSPVSAPSEPGTPSEDDEIGIPKGLRVKRHYDLSDAAIEARKKNSKARRPGSEGNKRNWKGGLFAKDFIDGRIKPCLSTCPMFSECELVSEGTCKPGGVCMDKASVIQTYSALMEAIKGAGPDRYDDFNSVAALTLAETIHVYRTMMENIMRDGDVVLREKYDKNGVIQSREYVPHPNLMAAPKLFADLGLTPRELNITPKAIKDDKNTEEANKTAAGLMSDMARRARDQSGKKEEEGQD